MDRNNKQHVPQQFVILKLDFHMPNSISQRENEREKRVKSLEVRCHDDFEAYGIEQGDSVSKQSHSLVEDDKSKTLHCDRNELSYLYAFRDNKDEGMIMDADTQ